MDMLNSSATVVAARIKEMLREDAWHYQMVAEALRRKADACGDEALKGIEEFMKSGDEKFWPKVTEQLDNASHYTDIASVLEQYAR